jgi:serine/threonine protein kinase
MLRPHDRIDKYEIRERIATGGMGTLYLAHDTTLDRTVALKLFQR